MKIRKITAMAMAALMLVGASACGASTNEEAAPAAGVKTKEVDDKVKDSEKGNAIETKTADNAESDNENAIDKTAIDTSGLSGSRDIAFFGIDTRGTDLGKGNRSDSLMVIHIDNDTESIKVVSVYRDCMVHIQDHGYEKITHAHSYGGAELAINTLNENFDLDISDYVTMNFINVADLVDMIDGVEMDITSEEVKFIDGIDSPGTYNLTGKQAVQYSRIRYASGGDYRRAERQRDVLFTMFEKTKGMDLATRIHVAESMLDEIATSMTKKDVTALMAAIATYNIEEMTAFPQVFYGGKVDGHWVEVPCSLIDMAAGMHEVIYEETDYEPSETVRSYSGALAGKASSPNTVLKDKKDEE